LWREAIRRPLPHGLLHWRYVLAHAPEPLSRQRSLWVASLPGLPRPAWAALEAWLWLRWQLWYGPKSVWRAVRASGRRVRDEEGLGLARQAWRVGTLSLGYCVPPSEIYRYRLYRPENRPRVAEFVYHHSLPSFHAGRNSAPDGGGASSQRLADKERQTAELASLGVPVVPIVAVVRRGASEGLEAYTDGAEPIFCKPRHGSRGQGAFAARREGDAIVMETLGGERLRGGEAAARWASLLHDDDMLVQPRLSVHPDLADLATEDDIVTVRYISERGLDESVGCYCATLEVPAGRVGETRRPTYVVLEVDALTGVVKPFPEGWLSGDQTKKCDRLYKRLGRRPVPGWERIRAGSHLAHTRVPGVHAIAWDWAVTPSGPLLLEGNDGWGPTMPQLLKGGLLATQH